MKVTMQVNGHPLTMELDTEATMSIVTSAIYKLFPKLPPNPYTVRLSSHTGDPILVYSRGAEGHCYITSSENSLPGMWSEVLDLVYWGGTGCNTLGWTGKNICSVALVREPHQAAKVIQVLQKYSEVF